MIRITIYFSCFACFFLAGGLSAQSVALVTQVSGEASLIQKDKIFELEAQDVLQKDDLIQTGANGKVLLQLSGGTQFQLGNNTRLLISSLASTPQSDSVFVSLLKGNLDAVISKLDRPTNVTVQTPTATASVRGTEFTIDTDEDEMQLGVNEGEVEVKSADGEVVRARPGKHIRARRREKLQERALEVKEKERFKNFGEIRKRRLEKFREHMEKVKDRKDRPRKLRDRERPRDKKS